MASSKISALSAVTSPLAADELVLARSGATKKIAAQYLVPILLYDKTLLVDTQTFDTNDLIATLAGYNHLEIRAMLRTDSGNNDIYGRFNADSGSNYDWENLLILNNATPAGSQSVQGVGNTNLTMGYAAASTYPANEFGMYSMDVLFYGGAQLKKFHSRGSVRAAASSGNIYLVQGSGTWRSTAAITRFQMFANSKFVAGSQLQVYGRL